MAVPIEGTGPYFHHSAGLLRDESPRRRKSVLQCLDSDAYARCMHAATNACSGPVVVPADSSHLDAGSTRLSYC
jgi:hypothetical protein